MGDQWISVKERLPEIGTWCLVFLEQTKSVYMSRFDGLHKGEWHYVFNIVSHWMPLPDPPKEV